MAQLRNQQLIQQIAVLLRQLREAKGVTQEDVYENTGIHIGRIETGQLNLTISTLEKLCVYFGITLAVFFERLQAISVSSTKPTD